MPLQIDKVHVLQKDEATNRTIVVSQNPYVRFVSKGEYPVCIQKGRFYTDGGDPIKAEDVPSWVFKEVKKMSPESRQSVGLSPNWVGPESSKEEPEPELPFPEEPSKIEDRPLVMTVVDAAYELDPKDDQYWTKDGMPQLSAINALVGRHVTRGEVEEVTNGFRRPTQEA